VPFGEVARAFGREVFGRVGAFHVQGLNRGSCGTRFFNIQKTISAESMPKFQLWILVISAHTWVFRGLFSDTSIYEESESLPFVTT
jgi:hypothetical protein